VKGRRRWGIAGANQGEGAMEEVKAMDSDAIGLILANQERLAARRANYEPVWREIDRWIDPFGAGGFDRLGAPMLSREIEDLFDVTGIDGLDRYTAAVYGITVPRGKRWHGVAFDNRDLMKLSNVQRWCERATDRLFIARYAPDTGFETQAFEDIRQEGKYGTSPLWIGEKLGSGLFYKTLHMSECFIQENYYGRVDTVHRLYCCTLLDAATEHGLENLSDKANRDFEDPKKRNAEIEILHVVRPNSKYQPGYLGVAGKRIESIYIEVGEKHEISRKGFHSNPIPVSRHITGPRDEYGRSPAMKTLATVKGINTIARTILDAGNRAVDPPLLHPEDSDITRIVNRPGGATAGGVTEDGKQLIIPLQTGGSLPVGLELLDAERAVVKRSFLEEFFRLLSDPSDRMTATQVLEQVQKEGVLIAPFASRRETEKIGPMVERELDIMMRAGAIEPFPPEVLEARATPRVFMTNPLSRMAKADEVTAFTRLVEIGIQAAGAGAPRALKRINFDKGMVAAGDVLGVPPSLLYSDEEMAEQDEADAQKQAVEMAGQVAPQIAGAALDTAKAEQIAQSLQGGGGL
jgi:hypothetical protein